jgi:hypothetical protein
MGEIPKMDGKSMENPSMDDAWGYPGYPPILANPHIKTPMNMGLMTIPQSY